jgi:ankyrin repeat protein
MDKKLLWKDFWSYLNYLHEELVDTAIEGCFEKLQLLLGETAACYPIDVNHKDFDDMTALHYSALEGHTECVKYLLENGANIEAVTQFRRKPIHFAALRGHTEVLDVLLSKRE